MVRMYRKKAIFEVLYTKEAIVDAIPVDNEDNFEGGRENNWGLKQL